MIVIEELPVYRIALGRPASRPRRRAAWPALRHPFRWRPVASPDPAGDCLSTLRGISAAALLTTALWASCMLVLVSAMQRI